MQEYIKSFRIRNNNTNNINDEMKYILRIVKSLKDSGLFEDLVSETIQNEAKEQKGGFLSKVH